MRLQVFSGRIDVGNDTFRLLGFFDRGESGNFDEWFRKKIAENTGCRDSACRRKKKRSFIKRYKMSDLQKYIAKRKKTDKEFAKNYDKDLENFRIGVLLRQARETSGVTQEEVAQKLKTNRSAISRIENHSEDIRLSTLRKYARAIGKEIHLEIA